MTYNEFLNEYEVELRELDAYGAEVPSPLHLWAALCYLLRKINSLERITEQRAVGDTRPKRLDFWGK